MGCTGSLMRVGIALKVSHAKGSHLTYQRLVCLLYYNCIYLLDSYFSCSGTPYIPPYETCIPSVKLLCSPIRLPTIIPWQLMS
jgi:hypothetical protein